MNKDKKGIILVVEDNLSNLKLVKDILMFHGYEVIEARDGKTALDKIQEYHDKLDLILMDIQLPEMDGFEVVKIIKSDNLTKNLSVFAISAYALEKDIKKALKVGCDEYITKPINLENFIEKINSFFKLKGTKF
ncbi:MAG: response regulator [bacterium]